MLIGACSDAVRNLGLNAESHRHPKVLAELWGKLNASNLELCGDFDMILDHFPRVSHFCATPHARCDMLYVAPIRVGC